MKAEFAERAAAGQRLRAFERFDEELVAMVEQIGVGPRIGNVYQVESDRTHRRLLMPVTRLRDYYCVLSPELGRIVVIWSGEPERGSRI